MSYPFPIISHKYLKAPPSIYASGCEVSLSAIWIESVKYTCRRGNVKFLNAYIFLILYIW